MKIIRTFWGTTYYNRFILEQRLWNDVVYVWKQKDVEYFERHGFTVRLLEQDLFPEQRHQYGKKLQALAAAQEEFGEVLLLDWDTEIVKPLNKEFFDMMDNDVLIPLYAHHKDSREAMVEACGGYTSGVTGLKIDAIVKDINKYTWEWNDGLVLPNFSNVYTRRKNFGKELLQIALENNLEGLVEEYAMWIWAGCDMEDYMEKYLPKYCHGISSERYYTRPQYRLHKIQKELNDYIEKEYKMDLYFNH